jgi:hypothetical protein
MLKIRNPLDSQLHTTQTNKPRCHMLTFRDSLNQVELQISLHFAIAPTFNITVLCSSFLRRLDKAEAARKGGISMM